MGGTIRSFDDLIEHDLGWRGFGPAQWVLLLIGGLAYVTMGAIMFLNVFQVGGQPEWLCVAPDTAGTCGGAGRALLASAPRQPHQLPPAAPATVQPTAPAAFGPSTAPAATPTAVAAALAAAAERQLRSSGAAATAAAAPAAPSGSSMCGLAPGAQYVWAQPSLTLTSEYNLVCSDTWKVSLLETLFFAGFMAGNGIFGRLADRHGRRATMAGCAAATAVLTALSAAPHLVATGPGVRAAQAWAETAAGAAGSSSSSSSSSTSNSTSSSSSSTGDDLVYGGGSGFYVNVVLRCLSGLVCAGQALGAYVLATEVVGPAWRGTAGMLTQTFYILGEFMLVGLSLALPAWRHLTLAAGLGCGLVAALVPLVPESPRWLLLHGRHQQAHAALMWVARLNRRSRAQPLPSFSCTPEGDIYLHPQPHHGYSSPGSRVARGPAGADADAAEQGWAGGYYARASLTEGLMQGGGGGSREGSGKSESGGARTTPVAASSGASSSAAAKGAHRGSEPCLLEQPSLEPGLGMASTRNLALSASDSALNMAGRVQGEGGDAYGDGYGEREEEADEDECEALGEERMPLVGSGSMGLSTPVAPAAPVAAAAAAAVAGASCGASGSGMRVAAAAAQQQQLAAGGFGSPASRRGSRDLSGGHQLLALQAEPSNSVGGGPLRESAAAVAAVAGGDAPVSGGAAGRPGAGAADASEDEAVAAVAAAAAAVATEAESGSLRLILAHRVTRSLLLSASFVMFALSVAYYGVTLALGTLAGSLHLNFFLTAVAELPGYLAIAATTDKLGRRAVIGGGTALAGVACLLCAFASGGPVQVALAMAGKLGCSGAWAVGLTFASELFPTSLRSVALSVASQSGDLGGLVTPVLLLLGPEGSRLERLPFAGMGLMALAAVALVWRLPETRGMPQLETFEELLQWLRRRAPGVCPDADVPSARADGDLPAGGSGALEVAVGAGVRSDQVCLSRTGTRDRSGSSKAGRTGSAGGKGGGGWGGEEAAWLRTEGVEDMAADGARLGPTTERAPLLARRLTSGELELPVVKP